MSSDRLSDLPDPFANSDPLPPSDHRFRQNKRPLKAMGVPLAHRLNTRPQRQRHRSTLQETLRDLHRLLPRPQLRIPPPPKPQDQVRRVQREPLPDQRVDRHSR
ncbi:BnaAnng05370D [Brassica napus]|uniref:BnaAnng05370D protein n=1 Tax=Brassica napus TaxID=3708 RepID=A0A078HPA2_BRANA|nr:BnaAnng05370D [Brassica napus]